jgi:endonuclease/exonuclease/phosphatase family metal-dependent hydrolase
LIFGSRNVHDSGDFHQRICLQASIALSAERTVNVFVTHLSLSQEARLRTLPEIQQFVDSFPKQPAVLMGDFNGEVAISDFGNTSMVLQDAWLYSQHKYFGHDQNVPLPSKSCPAQASAAASTSFDVVVESSGNIAMASHSADLTPIENQPANHEGQIRISSPSTSTPVLQDVHSANVPIERATLNADVQPLTGPTPSLNIDTNQHLTCQPNVDASLDFTFSAWRPRSRIDYIFTRHLNVLESRLIGVDSTLVDDLVVKGLSGFESGGGVDLDGRMYASDHRLLLSEVELQ